MRNNRRRVVVSLVLLLLATAACGPPAATPTTIPERAVSSRCGDGVCDDAERANPALCPQDCGTPSAATAAPASTTSPPSQPNIVFILTDDGDLASLEYMPKLKELITDQGVTLSSFFISMPLCCPSRATILRGQYGHNTEIMGNELPFGGFVKFYELGEEDSTIATWLQAAGYRTMMAGKYLNAFPDRNDLMHIPAGWTEWYSPIDGDPYTQFDYVLNENGRQVEYGHDAEDYGTDVYLDKTLGFIERSVQAGQPFFAHVSVYAPHWPTTPAPRHTSLFNDARAPRTANWDEEDVSDKPSYIRKLALTEEPVVVEPVQ